MVHIKKINKIFHAALTQLNETLTSAGNRESTVVIVMEVKHTAGRRGHREAEHQERGLSGSVFRALV
jgi:hypothetical protein